MAASFEDIVAALCTQVTTQHPNDFQRVYLIPNAKEARLAYDVLVAHGFDAKVYHDDDQTNSKLYISPPDGDASARLASALAYANGLAAIRRDADALFHDNAAVIGAAGVSMTLANLSGGGKQIVIQLTPPAVAAPRAAAAKAAAVTPAVSQPVAPKQVKRHLGKKQQKEDAFGAGPSLSKRYYPGKLDAKAKAEQNSPLRQLILLVTGNMATGLSGAIIAGAALLIIISVAVLLKGMLCTDFARAKNIRNHSWYCEDSNESQMTQ